MVPLPPPVAPFSAPCWQGKEMYVPVSNTTLPNLCVKCAQPATVIKNKTYAWVPQWVAVLFLLGALPYLIVAMIIRKSIKMQVPMCAAHQKTQVTRRIIGIVLLVLFVPVAALFAQAGDAGTAIGLILAFVMFFAGLFYLVFGMNCYLRPMFIDKTYAKFRGPCDEFLRQLPMKP